MATKPVEIEILLKDRLSGGLDAMQRKLDALMAGTTSSAERVRLLETAIGALNVQLAALKEAGEAANPDLDQSGNIAAIEKVEAKIKELQTQLNTLNETAKGTQTVPPDAGQAVKQYNGLHMSIQQIAREMPSLAMGPQMFFLAISNNLPIFTDELARARKEYDALTASGQKATPVWKQVLSSLFSWQTALTTGIMLLVMYGDEIVDWVAGLFKARTETAAAAEEQRNLNAAMGEARSSAAKETAQLTLLYKMTQNTNASLNDRRAAVLELQRQYPAYFGNLSQEAILAGEAAEQYRQLANDILQAAYARAYQKRIENLAEQNVGLQRAINADTHWTARNREEYNRRLERIRISTEAQEAAAGSSTDAAAAAATAALERQTDAIITEYDRRTEALEKNRAQLKANEQAMQSYEQEILKRQKPLMQTTQGQSYAENWSKSAAGAAESERRVAQQRLQTQEQLGRELTELERQNQEARTAAMAEGLDKQLQQIRDAYSRRSAEVDQLEAQWTQKSREAGLEGLTPEQTDALAEARRAALQEMNQAAEQARREDAERQQDEQDRQRQAWNEYLIEYGNVQEKRQAIAQKYAILIRRAETEGEKATLTRQMQDELDEFDNKVKGSTTLMAQLFADTARRSTSELDRLVEKAELLMRYLAATKDAQGTALIDGRTVTRGDILSLGVSEHTLGRLQQSAEETESLAGAIRKLRGELGSRSPFLALRTQLEDATAQMKSGDLSGGIEQMASAVGDFMPAVEQLGRELGTIFGDDRLGERIGGVADAMAGMAGVAGGVGRAMSGDVVGGAAGIVSGISTIVSALDGLWGADYSRFEAMSEQYDRLTAVWDTLIDKKREYLAESWGTEAEAAHDEAVALLREQQEAARELARQRNQSGASAGSHSIGYRQNEWIGQAADELARYVDASRLMYGNKFAQSGIDAAGTLLSATASELEAVRENMAGLWASLDADFRSALEDIIEAEDQIAQLGESLKEQLTQVSFDSLYDSFVDTLMDMDAEAGDFAEGLTEQFMRAALSQQVGQLYQERLRGWYDRFAAAMSGDDQRLTDAEMEALRAEYQGIVDDALRLRDQLAAATGYTGEAGGTTQTGRAGSFNAMSQEQGTKLEGLFTSGQMHWASIDEQMQDVSEQMAGAVDHLRRIEENTGNSARHLGEIKEDIRKILRDGLRVK